MLCLTLSTYAVMWVPKVANVEIVPAIHLEQVDIEEIQDFDPPLITPPLKPVPKARDALKS